MKMDTRKSHLQTMWILCIIFISIQVVPIYALTSSLALQQSDQVVVGNTISFTCTASGSNGADPSLVWNIKTVAGDVTQTLTGSQDGGSVTTDGSISSTVTFTVTNSHVGKRLWCGAVEQGTSAPAMQIYTEIVAATNVADLGEDCSGNAVCTPYFSLCQIVGTSPIQYVCRCSNNYYDTNGVSVTGGSCVAKSGLGGSCQTTVPDSCLTQNAECSSSTTTCVCQTGFIRSNTICIPDTTAGLGESCVNPTRTCSVTASECTSSGTCGCQSNYYESASNVCSPRGTIGQACIPTIADSCSTANSYCSNTAQTCTCNTGRTYIASTNSCDLPVLGQTCTASPGCKSTSTTANTANPQCTNSVCTCPSGYYALSSVCYAKSGLGSSCSTSGFDSCSDVNSQCTGTPSTCQCNFGYVAISSTCVTDTSTDTCPSSTQVAITTYGVTNPSSSSTPDTRVAKTCYTVDLYGTVTLECADMRGNAAPALQFGGWIKQPANEDVIQQTGRFINGDFAIPSLTISNAQSSDDASYICQLCYGTSRTRCTDSNDVRLYVIGTEITSVSVAYSPTSVTKGQTVNFSCATTPANVATSYRWLWNGVIFRSTETFQLENIQAANDGTYLCEASNTYGSTSSETVTLDVQYLPEYSLPGGGDTINRYGNLDTAPITIQCTMTGNPAIHTYYFYDSSNAVVQSTSSSSYTVYITIGYGTYRCEAENQIGRSTTPQYFNVQLETSTLNTGAATAGTSIATGTVAAIVLGIIFLILLIIIIVVCCCSYGWCRKKEKTQVEPEKPIVPYIPRSVTSAVSRKDVGVSVNGIPPSEYDEPRYLTPRFYLKPATNGGPIISMYDDNQHQPRAHQLPSLDTQYLYTDDEPKKRHRKHKRRRRHHHPDPEPELEPSPRQTYYDPELAYAEVAPPDNDDLVVVPGKQNYFE